MSSSVHYTSFYFFLFWLLIILAIGEVVFCPSFLIFPVWNFFWEGYIFEFLTLVQGNLYKALTGYDPLVLFVFLFISHLCMRCQSHSLLV